MLVCKKCGAVAQKRDRIESAYRWRNEGPPPGDGWVGPVFPHAQLQMWERSYGERFFECKFICPNQKVGA